MNCRNWEERIALWVGGDLATPEALDVERHVADCPGCQVFASGIKQSLEALRGAHAEPIAEAHFAAVRARVLGRLEADGWSWWKWVWLGGTIAAAVFGFVMVVVPRRTIEPPLAAVVHPAPPASVETIASSPELWISPSLVARQSQGGRRRKTIVRSTKKPEPLLVKLVTDDPDVVIYWFADNKEGDK